MKIASALIGLALLSTSVQADWTPSGPIKTYIGFKAGGGADTMSRLIAEDIQTEFGWTMLPQNLTGAGGAVMARELKSQPADGTAIGLGITDTFAYGRLAARDPGYKLEDFDYLSTLAGTQMGIVAKTGKGWKNFSDVIKAAKSGTKISFGSMTPRLADGAYYIGKVNNVDFNIVSSYKGGKDVLNAINADDIDLGWVAGPQKSGVESGDLVNLANGEDIPLFMSPDAQPLSELGVDFSFGATFLAMAPAGLPDDAKEALINAISTVLKKEGTQSNTFITKVFSLKVKSGDDAMAYIKAESDAAATLLAATAE